MYLGLDFGTSGARGIAIDRAEEIVAEINYPFKDGATNLTQMWRDALYSLLDRLPEKIKAQLEAIAIDGTSATTILCDRQGHPIEEAILYNDARGASSVNKLKAIAPANSVVLSATSSLSKLWWWYERKKCDDAAFFLHQADWLAFLLHGNLGITDHHNVLKLGYDIDNLIYPQWLENQPFFHLLPKVLPPGTPIDTVSLAISQRFGLSRNCLICTGTTDSIAAFVASRADRPGEGVTSLGSTIAIKLLSQTKVEDARYGIYSHRLGNFWLAGGASNAGGAVLRHFFNNEELARLSQQIDSDRPSPYSYYPLLKPGERFPINDPQLQPRFEPRSDDPVEFLQGLLEGLARIEALGYQKLQELGASQLAYAYTAGGGAKNTTWQRIRQRYLKVPVIASFHTEAAYGTALLAKKFGFVHVERIDKKE
jgi:sugar (pentulose or hexulose) kinase